MKRRLLLRRLVSVLVLTLGVTGLAWIGLAQGGFTGFQNRATDALFPAAVHDPRVVVVGVDRESVNEAQQPLPWSRDKWARIVDQLAADGAAVIAFDFTFSAVADDAPEQTRAANQDFADSIARAGNVVLGVGATKSTTPDNGPPVAVARDVTTLDPKLAAAAAAIGHVQVTQDPADGVVRRVPLVMDIDGAFVPALSVAAVSGLQRQLAQPVVRSDGITVGNRFIPADRSTNMILNWTAPLSSPPEEISAWKVHEGKIDPAKVRGKLVFIGATDPLTGDLRLAPTDKSGRLPGVFLHANAANTILTSTYLEPVSDASVLGWVALLTALVGLSVLMLPFWASPVIAVLLGLAYVVFAFARLDGGALMNLVYPLVAIVVSFVLAMGIKYFAETRQRRRVTALFSQYVPESVAQRLVDEDRAELAAEGQRLDMTVLFCDLRGFTALSEKLPPSIVRTMLDHYYDRVTELVLGMRGTLMKYVGDEVFAVWGAPIPTEDHPALALECAMAIQALTPELNAELRERGAPEVSFGIGLNTGEAVAAHFGGGRRRQYDVVGDTVNVGARLCSAAGRGEIILSDAVLDRVPDPPPVEPVGKVELKGVTRELTLWRVVAAESGTVLATDPAATTADGDGLGFPGPDRESEPLAIGQPGRAASVSETHAGGGQAEG
ncbi:MAG: CHASE2 domain-containing protein [Acidimicrobiia bacterium]